MKHTQCRRCVFHRKMSFAEMICNYACVTGKTCLTIENGKTIDRRGNDPDDCKLFQEGKAIPERDYMLFGTKMDL